MRQLVWKWALLLVLLVATGTAPAGAADETTAEPGSVKEPPRIGEAAPAPNAPPADTGSAETLKPSFDPFDWLVYKPLWTLNGWIGNFNPIGNHVSAPIEKAVPGLRVKGFINSITQVNTTANNDNVGLGGRVKDWRLQKQEFRTQLELRYQATDQLEVVSVNNFQFEGAYRWNDSDGLWTDGSSNQEYYSQGKRIFREAYLRGNYGKVNFTLGKQIVNWGKMDGKVVDIVNAADGRDVVDFHIGDYEWRAIGQWMAYLSLRPIPTATVSLLWNPDFQPNVGPAFGSPWWYPFVSVPQNTQAANTPVVKPDGWSNLRDSEVGGRVDTTIGALSLSGIYYYGFDRDGTTFNDGSVHFLRTPKYGYALDYGTNILGQRLIIRSEGLYTHGKVQAADDSIVRNDSVKIAFAFETSVGADANKVDLLYQPIYTRALSDPFHTGTKPYDLLHVVNISHSVRKTNDKLSLSATGYINGGTTWKGWAATYAAGWTFSDYVKGTLAFNDFQGKDTDIPWGAYSKWKNVTADIKYEF